MEINYLDGIIVVIKWFGAIALSSIGAAILLSIVFYIWYQVKKPTKIRNKYGRYGTIK